MASKFDIIISATNNATKGFDAIGARLQKLGGTFGDLDKKMRNFKRENKSGLDKLSESFGGIAEAAGGVLKTVATLGGVAGLAVVGGLELSSSWGRAAQSLQNVAGSIGVPTGKLQQLDAAAKLAGVSSEAMDQSLRTLGGTLHDAKWGRNRDALLMLQALGLQFRLTKTGAIDTEASLKDLAGEIAKRSGNAQTQARIADAFGMGELLPMLQKGASGIDELMARAQALGIVMGPEQIGNAERYAEAMTSLDLTVNNLKNSIGAALIPVLQPLLAQMTDWITANKAVISTGIATYAADIAKWVRDIKFDVIAKDVKDFVGAVQAGVEIVGGLKNALMIVAGISLAPLAASLAGLVSSIVSLGPVALALLGITGGTAAAVIGGAAVVGGVAYGLPRLLNELFKPGADGNARGPGSQRDAGRSRPLLGTLEQQHGLPQGVLDGVYAAESSRGKNLVSPKGAQGPFQFMPQTAKQYNVLDPFDFGQSADGAARMLADLQAHFGGDTTKALAAYNWGQGNVDRDVASNGADWLAHAPKETQDYVARVQNAAAAPAGMVELVVRFENAPAGMKATARSSGPVNIKIGLSALDHATV